METFYYTIDAKRLTMTASAEDCQACGGQNTVCYAFVPSNHRKKSTYASNVVDFSAYRSAHFGDEENEADELSSAHSEEDTNHKRGLRDGWKIVDICSSAAVIAAAVAAVISFVIV